MLAASLERIFVLRRVLVYCYYDEEYREVMNDDEEIIIINN